MSVWFSGPLFVDDVVFIHSTNTTNIYGRTGKSCITESRHGPYCNLISNLPDVEWLAMLSTRCWV